MIALIIFHLFFIRKDIHRRCPTILGCFSKQENASQEIASIIPLFKNVNY